MTNFINLDNTYLIIKRIAQLSLYFLKNGRKFLITSELYHDKYG